MTDKDAMKLALEFIERVNKDGWILADFEPQMYQAITAIKDALAQPEQEPVAWQFMNGSSFRKRRPDDFSDLASDGLPYWRPLYTTPPQRTEPICPECKAEVLYECVACSSNNYPSKENT